MVIDDAEGIVIWLSIFSFIPITVVVVNFGTLTHCSLLSFNDIHNFCFAIYISEF